MKSIFISCFCFLIFFISCDKNNKLKLFSHLPGVYVRYSEHEFGKEYDTLVIKEIETAYFKLTRLWTYERVLDGEYLRPENKHLETYAVYDVTLKAIVELGTRNVIFYSRKENKLNVGNTKYSKIK